MDKTCLSAFATALAKFAFDMLLARIRDPGAPVRETFLTAPLVVRASTRKPQGAKQT